MKELKAVIFDLDGTLLDTLDDLADATNETLTHFGYLARTREEVRAFIGNGVENLLRRALPADISESLLSEAATFFRADYGKRNQNRTAPYPGILSLLSTLRERGVRIGVVSNKYDAAVRALCEHYFPALIDLSLGERAGVPKKPAPDALFFAMKELGATADTTVYVGDSEVDVETARNAALPCISVLWGLRDKDVLDAAGATVYATTTDEILSLLQEFF